MTLHSLDATSSDSRVITFYNNVGEEVDSHFNRALLSSLVEPATRQGNADTDLLPPAQTISSSVIMPMPSTAGTSPATCGMPPLDPDTMTTANHTPLPSPFGSQTNKGVILYPELASLLVHPEVDCFADAPRVPGQPLAAAVPPDNVKYIPSISFNEAPPFYYQSCARNMPPQTPRQYTLVPMPPREPVAVSQHRKPCLVSPTLFHHHCDASGSGNAVPYLPPLPPAPLPPPPPPILSPQGVGYADLNGSSFFHHPNIAGNVQYPNAMIPASEIPPQNSYNEEWNQQILLL